MILKNTFKMTIFTIFENLATSLLIQNCGNLGDIFRKDDYFIKLELLQCKPNIIHVLPCWVVMVNWIAKNCPIFSFSIFQHWVKLQERQHGEF